MSDGPLHDADSANDGWPLAVAGLGVGMGLLGLAVWRIASACLYSRPLLDTPGSLLWGFGLAGAAVGLLALSGRVLWGFRR